MKTREITGKELLVLGPGSYKIISRQPVWISGTEDIITEAEKWYSIFSRYPIVIGGCVNKLIQISYKSIRRPSYAGATPKGSRSLNLS